MVAPFEGASGTPPRLALDNAILGMVNRKRMPLPVGPAPVLDEAVSVPSRWFHFFVRPLGDSRWDLFLRGTALIALAAIPIAVLFPWKIPLIWFALVAVPACGPIGIVIPVALEPLIFEVSKYEAPISVTVVSMCVLLYAEYFNWRVFSWVINHDRLRSVRDRRLVRLSVEHFSRAPFATVAIVAMSPIPFWIIRAIAILNRYPIRRYFVAMTLGRLPRLFVLAWLGARLRVSTMVLVFAVAVITLASVFMARGRRATARPSAEEAPGAAS